MVGPSTPRTDDRPAPAASVPDGPSTYGSVADDPPTVGDRAQLVLVGSVAIAFAILGLVVVFNTILFSGGTAAGGVSEDASSATEFDYEVRNNVQSIVLRTNHDRTFANSSNVSVEARRHVRNYSHLLGLSYAESSHVYTNVSYNRTMVTGRRIVQNQRRNFTYPHVDTTVPAPPSAAENWYVVDEHTEIGWLAMNLNVSSMDAGDPFVVWVNNSTGGMRLELNRTENANGSVFLRATTNFTKTHAANDSVRYEPQSRYVLVDVLGGSILSSQMSFNATEHLAGRYTVRFVDGDAVTGKWEVVTRANSTRVTRQAVPGSWEAMPYCDGSTAPCQSFAAWQMRVHESYVSETMSYNRTLVLPVYEGGSRPLVGTVLFTATGDQELHSVDLSGEATELPRGSTVDGVTGLGPIHADFDGDRVPDAPYVTDDTAGTPSELHLYSRGRGTTTTLASNVRDSGYAGERVAVGTWNGSATAVFYAGAPNGHRIYRVGLDGTPTPVFDVWAGGSGYPADRMAGFGDVDGDGAREMVYVDGSGQPRYVNPDGTRGGKVGTGLALSPGDGVGQPADFDNDGVANLPVVGGSGGIRFANENGTDRVASTAVLPQAASEHDMAVVDWDQDGSLGIVYIGTDDDLYHVDEFSFSGTSATPGDTDQLPNGAPISITDTDSQDNGVA